jgi:uncharacterized protein (DUF1501 family)
MKDQNVWADITIVGVSEFGRTLTMNSAAGSDHAWGSNAFIIGGEVNGKRILGRYPDVLSNDGPEVITPGIMIPSTPWDSVWNAVSEWFGITTDEVSLPLTNTQNISNLSKKNDNSI